MDIQWTKINSTNQKTQVDGVTYYAEKITIINYGVGYRPRPRDVYWSIYSTSRADEFARADDLRTAKAQFAALMAQPMVDQPQPAPVVITRHAPMTAKTETAILGKLTIVALGYTHLWLETRVKEISKGRTALLSQLDETEGMSFYMDLRAMRVVNKHSLATLLQTARSIYPAGKRGNLEAAENLRRICRQVSKYRTCYAECLTENEARAALAILNGRHNVFAKESTCPTSI